jgi:hypothetical protein
MTFWQDDVAQAALVTLGAAGIGPVSTSPGIGFAGDGSRRPCLHAFCFVGDEVAAKSVAYILLRTVGPPAGPSARWALHRLPSPEAAELAAAGAPHHLSGPEGGAAGSSFTPSRVAGGFGREPPSLPQARR